MKSRDASYLISAAVGPLALNADAGQYKLSEPCLNDGKNLLAQFKNMKNASRERRNRVLKKRSAELLQFCAVEL